MTTAAREPNGVGGWLILPVIGLFVLPVRILLSLNRDFLPIFQQDNWDILTIPGSQGYHSLWGQLILFEMACNISLVIFDIALLYLLIRRFHRFPALYILFLVFNLIFVTVDSLIGNLIPEVATRN